MADLIVVEEFSAFLEAQGLVSRDLDAAPAADVATAWENPRDGAPAPRDVAGGGQELATVTLSSDILNGDPDIAPWITATIVDVVVRAREERDAILLQRSIADLVEPVDQLGGRKQWEMRDLLVERSYIATGDQRMPVVSDFYDRVQRIVFQCRRKSLAGLPYLP